MIARIVKPTAGKINEATIHRSGPGDDFGDGDGGALALVAADQPRLASRF